MIVFNLVVFGAWHAGEAGGSIGHLCLLSFYDLCAISFMRGKVIVLKSHAHLIAFKWVRLANQMFDHHAVFIQDCGVRIVS